MQKPVSIKPKLFFQFWPEWFFLFIQTGSICCHLSHNRFINFFINSEIIIIKQSLFAFRNSDTFIKIPIGTIFRRLLIIIQLCPLIKEFIKRFPLLRAICQHMCYLTYSKSQKNCSKYRQVFCKIGFRKYVIFKTPLNDSRNTNHRKYQKKHFGTNQKRKNHQQYCRNICLNKLLFRKSSRCCKKQECCCSSQHGTGNRILDRYQMFHQQCCKNNGFYNSH